MESGTYSLEEINKRVRLPGLVWAPPARHKKSQSLCGNWLYIDGSQTRSYWEPM